MRTCYICNNLISHSDNNHVYRCSKLTGNVMSKPEIKFQQIQHEVGVEIREDEIVRLYVDSGWSLPDFKNKYGLAYSQTKFLLDYFGIAQRTLRDANRSTSRRKKYEETCKTRYGVTNVSKLDTIKSKKADAFRERYGVDNVWKSESFKSSNRIRMINLYGVGSLPNRYGNMQKFWDSKDVEFKKTHMKPANTGYKKWYDELTPDERVEYNKRRSLHLCILGASSIELEVASALVECDIAHETQKWISRRSYDFRLLGTNIIIEVNGDYWHANPSIYNGDDTIKYPDRIITAAERWLEDEEKTKVAESHGYKVITVWESEIKAHRGRLGDLLVEKIRQV